VADALAAKGLAGAPGPEDGGGTVRFFATDSPERFARVGAIFLSRAIDPETVELVDLRAL
jgi:glutamate racemase